VTPRAARRLALGAAAVLAALAGGCADENATQPQYGNVVGVWSDSALTVTIDADSTFRVSGIERGIVECCFPAICDTPTYPIVLGDTVHLGAGEFALEDSADVSSGGKVVSTGFHGQFTTSFGTLEAIVTVRPQDVTGPCTYAPASVTRRRTLRPR
jgi:hypothetical protein